MTQDFASLGIRVDTADVKTGKADLDGLATSATRAETAAGRLKPAFSGVGKGLKDIGQASGGAASPLANSANQMKAATLSAKQYSQAMRLLPAQITDVVTSLASGSPAYLVAIQQGGQLRDSFGGIGNTLKALASVITPARVLIGATAGAAALLAKGFIDGQAEGYEFAKAIALSGNAAGVTRDQLADMAASIDDVVGTQAEAASTLAALVGTGRVAADDLREFTLVAQNLKRNAGVPIEETVKAFAELGRRPLEASMKLNESMNYLTISVYRQIKALQEQGRLTEAAEVAQRAFAAAQDERSAKIEQNLGTLQRAAKATGGFFKEMWDGILNVGRHQTISEQLKAAEQQLAAFQSGGTTLDDEDGFGGVSGGREKRVAAMQTIIAELRRLEKAETDAAKATAEQVKKNRDAIDAEEERTKVLRARREAQDDDGGAKFGSDISALQRSLSQSLSGYSAYAAQLEVLRDSDLVSDEAYFAAKRELILRDAALRTKELQAEISRTSKESDRLTQAKKEAVGAAGPAESDRLKAGAPFDRESVALLEKRRALEAEILDLQIKSGSAVGVVVQQQEQAGKIAQRSLDQARASAQAYLDVVQQQRQREVDSQGQGNRQRQFNSGVNDIEDRFAEERRRLDDQRARGDIKSQEEYDKRLAIAQEFRDKDLAGFEDYWAALTEKQGDFFVGASEAFANYIDEASNVASLSERAFSNAFEEMEDRLVEFAMTGKGSFKDFANSVISEIIRIQAKAALAKAASSLGGMNWGGFLAGLFGIFSPAGGIGAGGGTIPSGSIGHAAAGEKFVPRDNMPYILHKGEAVLPANMNPFAGGKGMGGTNLTINSTLNVAQGTNAAQFQSALEQNNERLKAEILENFHRQRWAA